MIPTAYRQKLDDAEIGITKRELILHDSFAFLVLGLATLALFAVTLFLFRSFEGYRLQLAKSGADRGREQLQKGEASAAVASLQASLAYAPDDYATQLLLAQALAGAGEIDEATNYYLNLWAAQPGDGFLNLQLARLARRKGNRSETIQYYRGSIFGDWRGDARVRRRDVRLELVDYLVQAGDLPAARAELLIAAGNAPDDLQLHLMFAERLRALGDAPDALTYYQKAVADDPHSAQALEGAGSLMFDQGDYAKAHTLLTQAEAAEPRDDPHRQSVAQMAADAERLEQHKKEPRQ